MPDDPTIGTWREFLLLLLDAEARSVDSPYGLRSVEDVAVDAHRMAVSDELRHGKAYLRITRKDLQARIDGLRKVIREYDEAQDA